MGASQIFTAFKIDNLMLGLRWELSSNRLAIFEIESKKRGQKNQRAERWALRVEALIFLDFLVLFGQAKRTRI
jgi:hypothetical protein